MATAVGVTAPGGLPTTLDPLRAAVRDKVHVSSGSIGDVSATMPSKNRPDETLVTSFQCPGEISSLTIRDDLSDAIGSTCHTLAHITVGTHSQQFSFGPDARETTLAVGPAAAAARGGGLAASSRLGSSTSSRATTTCCS